MNWHSKVKIIANLCREREFVHTFTPPHYIIDVSSFFDYYSIMAISDRKRRQIQERDQAILDVSCKMLMSEGYLGLNMDKIAQAIEYSKGTVYQHYKSKEEVLAALAVKSLQKRLEFFERARDFDGLPRERMTAVGVADGLMVLLYPHFFIVDQLVSDHSLWDKISSSIQNQLKDLEDSIFACVGAVTQSGVESGDLDLGDRQPQELCIGLWAMSLGVNTINLSPRKPFERIDISRPLEVLHRNQHCYLDGWHWKPLYKDHDYDHVRQRILKSTFQNEYEQLQANRPNRG